jgi:hypothetical protein
MTTLYVSRSTFKFAAEIVKLASGNYIVPKEKKNFADANAACASRGMGLASLESLAETDMVQDYLSSKGENRIETKGGNLTEISFQDCPRGLC